MHRLARWQTRRRPRARPQYLVISCDRACDTYQQRVQLPHHISFSDSDRFDYGADDGEHYRVHSQDGWDCLDSDGDYDAGGSYECLDEGGRGPCRGRYPLCVYPAKILLLLMLLTPYPLPLRVHDPAKILLLFILLTPYAAPLAGP